MNYTSRELRDRLNYLRSEHEPREAGRIWRNEIREKLGIGIRVGSALEHYRDEAGAPAKRPNTYPARDFSVADIGEMIFGIEKFRQRFNPNSMQEDALEASAQDPSTLQEVSLFNATVAGLVESQILEEYGNAEFVGDQIVPTRSTRRNGDKLIGVTNVGGKDIDMGRLPNEPHQRLEVDQRWVRTPETEEKALAIDLTKEAVYFDYTGDLLDQASSVGYALRYEKEEQIARTIWGIDNTYNYKDVGYNTYQLAGGPWENDHVNPFTDQNDVDDAVELFTRMRHPETGRVFNLNSDRLTIVHDPRQETKWSHHTMATEVRETTNTNYQALSGASEQIRNIRARYSSAIFRDVLEAGGYSQADAIGMWLSGMFERAFAWMENWPLTITQANANEYVMVDSGVAVTYFANHRGIMAVIDPRYVVRNLNS